MNQKFTAIILAKGAPNRTSTGLISMCAIALSEDIGLVRLYPLTFDDNADVSVWSVVSVEARRSSKDNRKESWRIESTELIGKIQTATEKSSILNACVLKSGMEDPISFQNKNRASIAVVKTELPIGCGLKPRKDQEPQLEEDDSWCMMQSNYPFKPYLLWTSTQGGEHGTHIVAQEVYYGMSKNPSSPFRVFENMRIGDDDYQHWLVLGNMKDRRNVWVCPHVHRLKKSNIENVLGFSGSFGLDKNWPYLTQEAINEKDPGLQLTLF